MTRVAVTGLAVASPFGRSLDEYWQGLLEGPPPARAWSPPGFADLSCLVARLPEHERLPIDALAVDLVRRALAHAGLEGRDDFALALGSHFAETDFVGADTDPKPMLAAVLAALKHRGPAVNTPIGCAAGNLSLAWALDRVSSGEAPFAVAGGVDLIGAGAAAAFDMLGNLSDTAARPFDVARDGILLGEGGAMLVLEPLEAAHARGATVLAELLAVTCAHDAEHALRPALDGHGLAEALRRALLAAGLEARDVGYVNAHSPGTTVNDPCEAAAYRAVFGARGVPVGSTKAAVGHAQGGANGLEAAACVLALQRQVVPGTLGVANVDASLELDVVTAPRKGPLNVAVSTASGMGGANAVAVFARVGVRGRALADSHARTVPSAPQYAEWKPSDGEPPPLKGASLAGRALVALASRFAPFPADTGVYQALGQEKLELTRRFAARARDGFANMKATAPVLEHSGYGPFVSLAIALGCRGPFWTVEADELAGAAALQQALTDLKLGRCARALVGACSPDGAAQLLLLEAPLTAAFTWSAARHDASPDDLHGLRALARGIEQRTEASFRAPSGRGLTVRFS